MIILRTRTSILLFGRVLILLGEMVPTGDCVIEQQLQERGILDHGGQSKEETENKSAANEKNIFSWALFPAGPPAGGGGWSATSSTITASPAYGWTTTSGSTAPTSTTTPSPISESEGWGPTSFTSSTTTPGWSSSTPGWVPPESSTAGWTTTTSTTSAPSTPGWNAPPETSTVKPTPAWLQCPTKDSDYPTYFPHESSCSHFYQCSHGKPYRLRCRRGLHFNPRFFVCDYPDEAGCPYEPKELTFYGETFK